MNRLTMLAAAGVLGLGSTTLFADEINFSMGTDLAFKQLGFSTFTPQSGAGLSIKGARVELIRCTAVQNNGGGS